MHNVGKVNQLGASLLQILIWEAVHIHRDHCPDRTHTGEKVRVEILYSETVSEKVWIEKFLRMFGLKGVRTEIL